MSGRQLLATAVIALAASANAEAGLLYSILESNNHLVSINTNTLAITDIGATGVGGDFGGLGYNANTDTLFWIPGRGNNNLYTLNRTTGAATLVGAHGINDLFGLEYDPSTNKLFASQFSGGSGLYSLNMATGAATTINPSMAHGIGGLAYDSKRDQLLGIEDGAGDIFDVNRATGALTLVFNGPFQNDSGLAYDQDKDLLWDIDFSGNLFKYDPNAGYARTTVLSGLGSHDGLAYVADKANAPLPGTLALLGLGFLGLGFSRRKKA